jgi:hypothetical protein
MVIHEDENSFTIGAIFAPKLSFISIWRSESDPEFSQAIQ